MDGDHEHRGDEPYSEDALYRRRWDIFDAEADLLRENAMLLLATGAVSIERPAGVVTARFRRPVWRRSAALIWRRRPQLQIEAVPADDSGRRAAMGGPMTRKFRDRTGVTEDIMAALALYLAWLEEDERPP